MTTQPDVVQRKKRKRGRPRGSKTRTNQHPVVPVLPKTLIEAGPGNGSSLTPQILRIIDSSGNLVTLQQTKFIGPSGILNVAIPVSSNESLLKFDDKKKVVDISASISKVDNTNKIPDSSTLFGTKDLPSPIETDILEDGIKHENSCESPNDKCKKSRDKEIHNAEEKRRKAKINNWIYKIGILLAKFPAEKQNKTSILERAFRYIDESKGKGHEVQYEVKVLLLRIKNLESVIIMLVELLKSHSLPIPDTVKIVSTEESSSSFGNNSLTGSSKSSVSANCKETNAFNWEPCSTISSSHKAKETEKTSMLDVKMCNPVISSTLPCTNVASDKSLNQVVTGKDSKINANLHPIYIDTNNDADFKRHAISDDKDSSNKISLSTGNITLNTDDLSSVSSANKTLQRLSSSTQATRVATMPVENIVSKGMVQSSSSVLLLQRSPKSMVQTNLSTPDINKTLDTDISSTTTTIPHPHCVSVSNEFENTCVDSTIPVNDVINNDVINNLWRPISSLTSGPSIQIDQSAMKETEKSNLNDTVDTLAVKTKSMLNQGFIYLVNSDPSDPSKYFIVQSDSIIPLDNLVGVTSTSRSSPLELLSKTTSVTVQSSISAAPTLSSIPSSISYPSIQLLSATASAKNAISSTQVPLSTVFPISLTSTTSLSTKTFTPISSTLFPLSCLPLSSSSFVPSSISLPSLPLLPSLPSITKIPNSIALSHVQSTPQFSNKALNPSSLPMQFITSSSLPSQSSFNPILSSVSSAQISSTSLQSSLSSLLSTPLSALSLPPSVTGTCSLTKNFPVVFSSISLTCTVVTSILPLYTKNNENNADNAVQCNAVKSSTPLSTSPSHVTSGSRFDKSASSICSVSTNAFNLDGLKLVELNQCPTGKVSKQRHSERTLSTKCTQVKNNNKNSKKKSDKNIFMSSSGDTCPPLSSSSSTLFEKNHSQFNLPTSDVSFQGFGIDNLIINNSNNNNSNNNNNNNNTTKPLLQPTTKLEKMDTKQLSGMAYSNVKYNLINSKVKKGGNNNNDNSNISSKKLSTPGKSQVLSSGHTVAAMLKSNEMLPEDKEPSKRNQPPHYVDHWTCDDNTSTTSAVENHTSTHMKDSIGKSNDTCRDAMFSTVNMMPSLNNAESQMCASLTFTKDDFSSLCGDSSVVSSCGSTLKSRFDNHNNANNIIISAMQTMQCNPSLETSNGKMSSASTIPFIKNSDNTIEQLKLISSIVKTNTLNCTSSSASSNTSTKRWGNVLENAHNSNMHLSSFSLGTRKRTKSSKNKLKNTKNSHLNDSFHVTDSFTLFDSDTLKSNLSNGVPSSTSHCSTRNSFHVSQQPICSKINEMDLLSCDLSTGLRSSQSLDSSTTDWIIKSSISLAPKLTISNSGQISTEDILSCSDVMSFPNITVDITNMTATNIPMQCNANNAMSSEVSKKNTTRTMKDRTIRNKWLEMEQGATTRQNSPPKLPCSVSSTNPLDQCASPVISFPKQNNRKRSLAGGSSTNENKGVKKVAFCNNVDFDDNSCHMFSAVSLCQSASLNSGENKGNKVNKQASKQEIIPPHKLKHPPDTSSLPTIINIFAPAPVPTCTSVNQSNFNSGISNFSAESLVNSNCNMNMMGGNNLGDSTFQDPIIIGTNPQLFTNFSADTLLSDNETAHAYPEGTIITQNNPNQIPQYWPNPWLSDMTGLNDSTFPSHGNNMQSNNNTMRSQRNNMQISNLQVSTECSPIKSIISILSTPASNNTTNINSESFDNTISNMMLAPHSSGSGPQSRPRRMPNQSNPQSQWNSSK